MELNIDLELIKKYNKPGPRYTSYPTAPHFRSDIPKRELIENIKAAQTNKTRNLSLYFHIPFCDTMCYFCGCTTIITKNTKKSTPYLDQLIAEMDLYKPYLNSDKIVEQMHFGGGTPTYLSPAQLETLGAAIHERFRFSDTAEIGCEIDPRELTREHILALRKIGVNRVSLGVQDFNEKVQKAVNRIQSEALIEEVTGWVRDAGIHSLNMDLIYGLPHQSVESFKETIEKILRFSPDRLAIFNYAHVPWVKPNQRLINEKDLPAPDVKLAMLKMMIEILDDADYVYIGMDHFAKADDELTLAQKNKTLQRNFQGYSTKAGLDIVAFGMSSISQYESHYLQNVKTLPEYAAAIENDELPLEKGYILSKEDTIRQKVITTLMCNLELDFEDISREIGEDFLEHFSSELSLLEEFYEDKLAYRNDKGIYITDKGRLFVRNIAMVFDEYLAKDSIQYSKTV